MAEPEPVPVRDLEVADRIARAVRGGRPADRTPTLEQLVAAFGEAEPTVDARRRAARALALAGVATVPDVSRRRPASGSRSRCATCAGAARCVAGVAGARRCSSPRWPRRPPRSTSATTTRRPTSRPAPPPTAAHHRHQHGDPGADDVDATDDLDRRQPPATAAERRRAKRARERRAREQRAKARGPRPGAQGEGAGGRQAPRHRAPQREPGDLPVRRGRRQAALQRHPHRRAHLPRARRAPQHRPRPEHAR